MPKTFEAAAQWSGRQAGRASTFLLAVALIVVWLVSGPLFGFSDTWQLVINTGTTIVTFLMVFLIQQSQNKDSIAVHLKLDELLAANRDASDRMIGIEQLDEQDLRELGNFYMRLAERSKKTGLDKEAHSIDSE